MPHQTENEEKGTLVRLISSPARLH